MTDAARTLVNQQGWQLARVRFNVAHLWSVGAVSLTRLRGSVQGMSTGLDAIH
jgi:hypothetical protein